MGEIEPAVAHQAHDDRAPAGIFGGEAQAALDGQLAAREGVAPGRQRFVILPVGVGRGRDGGNAEAVERGAGARAVALEIALERAGALGDGQLVVGPGEMVEADVHVAGAGEAVVREGKHREFRLGAGQLAAVVENLLRRFDPGDVRVAENGQPRGGQAEDVVDGARKGVGRLQRQAVDEIDAERVDALGAEPLDGLAVDLVGLVPVDGALDLGIGILHAERGAVGADIAERLDVFAREAARIDLDAELAVVCEREMSADERAEFAQLVRRKKRGSAAAEVDLGDGAAGRDASGGEGELAGEVFAVAGGVVEARGNDVGAAAEPAAAGAKRQVEIERERAGAGGVVVAQGVVEPEGGQVGGELGRRWVGGVARARNRVLADEVEIEAGVGRRHDGESAFPARLMPARRHWGTEMPSRVLPPMKRPGWARSQASMAARWRP